MKRLIAILVLAVLAFYVAWPAWSGYQIKAALDGKDASTLDRKIDFPSVRIGLRPAVTQKVAEIFERMESQAGPTGALIAGQLKGDAIPKIVETALATLVTPDNLIRVVKDGGTWKENAERILREQIGHLPGMPGLGGGATTSKAPGGFQIPGGLGDLAGKFGLGGKAAPAAGAPAPTPAANVTAAPASFGLGNIKRFAFLGPFAFEIGVAKDAAASDSDVTVQMAFSGSDWRVVKLVPRI